MQATHSVTQSLAGCEARLSAGALRLSAGVCVTPVECSVVLVAAQRLAKCGTCTDARAGAGDLRVRHAGPHGLRSMRGAPANRTSPAPGRAGAVYRPNVVRVGSEDAPLAARAREVWVDGLIRRYLDMDPGEWTYRYQARPRCGAALWPAAPHGSAGRVQPESAGVHPAVYCSMGRVTLKALLLWTSHVQSIFRHAQSLCEMFERLAARFSDEASSALDARA